MTPPSDKQGGVSDDRLSELRAKHSLKVTNTPRPTIAELEKILNATDDVRVEIQPNGEVRAIVGEESDAIVSAIDELLSARADLSTLRRENEALRAKLSREENEHAELQSECFDGFPTISRGIFDAYKEARADTERLDFLEASNLRWHDFGNEWNIWINGEKYARRTLREVADTARTLSNAKETTRG